MLEVVNHGVVGRELEIVIGGVNLHTVFARCRCLRNLFSLAAYWAHRDARATIVWWHDSDVISGSGADHASHVLCP